MQDTASNEKMPLDQAVSGEVYKDPETGTLYRIEEAYDVPTFTLRVLYSEDNEEHGRVISRVPLFHKRLTSVVRLVPDPE